MVVNVVEDLLCNKPYLQYVGTYHECRCGTQTDKMVLQLRVCETFYFKRISEHNYIFLKHKQSTKQILLF